MPPMYICGHSIGCLNSLHDNQYQQSVMSDGNILCGDQCTV